MAFTYICESDRTGFYCEDVGKGAYNRFRIVQYRSVFLGPIVGVAWRPKGSLKSAPGQPIRVSARDAFYDIIGPGGVANYSFLRLARDIDPR